MCVLVCELACSVKKCLDVVAWGDRVSWQVPSWIVTYGGAVCLGWALFVFGLRVSCHEL